MATTTCPNCGQPNRPTAKFCANCRHPLTGQPPAQGQPPAPRPPAPPAPPSPSPQLQRPTPPPAPPRPQPATPARAPTPPAAQPPPRASAPAGRGGLFPPRPLQVVLAMSALFILCLCAALMFAFKDKIFAVSKAATETPRATAISIKPTEAATPPTTVVIVITATPLPTTNTPAPSATPTATKPPAPTATPFTPTPIVDTPAGTELKPGETWHSGNLALTVENEKFARLPGCNAMLEFELILENIGATDLVIDFRGKDGFAVSDDLNRREVFYWLDNRPLACDQYNKLDNLTKPALAGKEKFRVFFQVRGDWGDTITKFHIQVLKAGRIQNAKWVIPVPR